MVVVVALLLTAVAPPAAAVAVVVAGDAAGPAADMPRPPAAPRRGRPARGPATSAGTG